MKSEKSNLFKILYCISVILFIAAFLYLCYIIRTRSWTSLDSDMSSELILARMLNEEGRILTPNWYYGTELRILYYTQISAVLFSFTDSWYMIRVITDILMIMILLVSVWCLVLRLGIRKFYPIVALIMIVPFSSVHYKYILYGAYYIPCIATSFFGLALMLHYVQTSDIRIRRIVFLGSSILAIVSSLIGYRQIVVFYLPVLISAVIVLLSELYKDKESYHSAESRGFLRISLISFMSAGIGCVINSLILIKIYPVEDWNHLTFARLSIERLTNTICSIVKNLGYREDYIGLDTLISNGYSMVLFTLFMLAVYKALKQRKSVNKPFLYCTVYSLCSIILLCLLYSLTDMVLYDRYSAPSAVFLIPVAVLFIAEMRINDNIKLLLCLILAVASCFVSIHTYDSIKTTDKTIEHREIASYLTEQGYYTGYSTFWNANVLTELSNGAIDMYCWQNEKMLPTVESVNSMWQWLQKVSHDSIHPSGKVFHLYNQEEVYFCPWNEGIQDDDIIYETENYVVYGYPSYDDMMSKLSYHDVILSESVIENGEYKQENIYLEPDGTLIESDVLLYEGTSQISIEGENLDKTTLQVKNYSENLDSSLEYELKMLNQNDTEIVATISVPEDTARSTLVLINNSDSDCQIKGINLYRAGP